MLINHRLKFWRPREEAQNFRDSEMNRTNFSCILVDSETVAVTPVNVKIPLDPLWWSVHAE